MELILSLGSNYGNRTSNLEKALRWLSEKVDLVKTSGIYETPDILGRKYPYKNVVAAIATGMQMVEFTQMIKNYEKQCGRDEKSRINHMVPIDIDIVVSDGIVLRKRDFNAEYFKHGYEKIIN